MAKVALLIGVSEYGSGLNPLPGAEKDIEAVQQVLQPTEMGSFNNVKQLLNPNPPVMREALETLFSDCTTDDLVLLFFSGYIVRDDSGNLYFATSITCKSPKPQLVRVSSIPVNFVQELMSKSPSVYQVVILDCYLSRMSDEETATTQDSIADIKTQLGGERRTILISGKSIPSAFDLKDCDPSVYTRYLAEGIGTGAADLDSDGWISVEELHEYASKKVRVIAPALKPEFYPAEDTDHILLVEVPADDPKLKYRRVAETWVRDGDISEVGREKLDELAESLQLSTNDCAVIEAEVLKPYQEYQGKLQRYKREFAKVISNDYPLDEQERKKLRSFQQYFGLREEDVAPLEEQLALKLASLSHSEDDTDEQEQGLSENEPNSSPATANDELPESPSIPPVQLANLTPTTPEDANEQKQLPSESEPNSLAATPGAIISASAPLPPVQLTNLIPTTPENTNEQEQLSSESEPKSLPTTPGAIISASAPLPPVQLANLTPATPENTNEQEQLPSESESKSLPTTPGTILSASAPLPPVQLANLTLTKPEDANARVQSLSSEGEAKSVSSTPTTVLPDSTPTHTLGTTNPTPSVNSSSSLASSPTRSASVSTFPNKFLLPVGIGGAVVTVALTIGIFIRKPAAPPIPSAGDEQTTTISGKKPTSSDSASLSSKVCTVFVNGNLRSEPASFRNNIVEPRKESLPVTGKQTKGGWVEVKLPDNRVVWAYQDIISNQEEMNDCLAQKGIPIKTIEDILPPN